MTDNNRAVDPVHRTTGPSLALVPETEGVLWTVRVTGGNTYLVVLTMGGAYDVHQVESQGRGVGYVGQATTQIRALKLVEEHLDS